MSTTIRRLLYTLYLIIITYNIVIVHGGISNDDDPDIVNNIQDPLIQMQYMQSTIEGSGSDTSTDITMTSIETSKMTTIEETTTSSVMNISNTTYYSTIDTTSSNSTEPPTTSPSPPFINPNTCNNPDEVRWFNNTCIPRFEAQKEYVNILRNKSSTPIAKVDSLISYFSITTNLTTTPNTPGLLTPREIDELINELDNITRNFTTLFIMALPTTDGNDTVLGALSKDRLNHEIVQMTKLDINSSNISAAVFINDQSINDINMVKVFILGEPTAYKNLDTSNNQSLVSSVIIANVQRKTNRSLINITLYFQVLNNDEPHINGRYSCSFFDTNTSKWNESGCTKPEYNKVYDRYQCSCNHLTTFALLWLPNIPQPNYLTSQDIASLIFLSISILCFIAIIIHSLTIRLFNHTKSLEARDLLPLISSASTTLLFIFYIALGMTVYTRTKSENGTQCFLSSSVLMFFVYFFLIFMFCAKTSVGYFNYLRFIHLFPEPSHRKLFILLIISFFISITWTSIAAGLNSNSSFNITQLHGNKICWFTRDVIYYFMTIPISIFLILNFMTIIFVTKRIINHARNATSPHQSYERMKRCVFVLLSSCVTQGIGWLFGPFLTFVKPTAADVLAWIFIIFNGLEGMWTILLYMIIRSQRRDESKRVTDSNKYTTKTSLISSVKSEQKRKISGLDSILERRFRVTHRNARKGRPLFTDLFDEESIDWETSSYEA